MSHRTLMTTTIKATEEHLHLLVCFTLRCTVLSALCPKCVVNWSFCCMSHPPSCLIEPCTNTQDMMQLKLCRFGQKGHGVFFKFYTSIFISSADHLSLSCPQFCSQVTCRAVCLFELHLMYLLIPNRQGEVTKTTRLLCQTSACLKTTLLCF